MPCLRFQFLWMKTFKYSWSVLAGMVTDEFLSSTEERSAWHEGVYQGFKVWNPLVYGRRLKADAMSFNQYEERENHYRDVAFTLTYFGKYVAVGVGAYLGMRLGLPV